MRRGLVAAADWALPGRRPDWLGLSVALVLIWGVLTVARPDLFARHAAAFDQDHALLSIDIAIARAFCDSPSKISPRVRLPYEARDNPALRSQPIRALILARTGTIQQFCLSVGSPVINNENGLMWVDSWLLWAMPDLSLDGLGTVLHGLMVGGLVFVSGILLTSGAGAIGTGTTAWCALVMLHQVDAMVLSTYPMDFVLMLVTAAIFAGLAWSGATRGARGGVTTALCVGAWIAFGANVRTSHLPVYVTLTAIAGVWAERAWVGTMAPRARTIRIAGLLLALIAGYAAYQHLAISRHLPTEVPDSAHHSTWHSIVIGLAIPPNDLSRREGLAWSDGSAWDLARRLKPGVPYLGEEYERVLSAYYRGLWRERPGEMLAVYALKGRATGKQMLEVLRGGQGPDSGWTRWVLRPLDALPDGWYLLALYAALGGAALAFARRGSRAGLVGALLSAIAVLVHLEAAAITSLYAPQYHVYLAFYCLAASTAAPFLALGVLWAAVRDRIASRL